MRLAVFVGALALMGLWELLAPARQATVFRPFRWFNNLGLIACGTALVWLVMPLLPLGAAQLAEQRRWGLFNRVSWPFEVELLLAFVILDFMIYLQHAAFHFIPQLWRLHRVHHADVDVDASTGVRFHPLELVLSMCVKLGAVFLLGAHWIAVLAFELALNAVTIFNHANVSVPGDSWLRWLVVTPDMHRVHHSTASDETDSNFGFNLPWWDRLLGTYRAAARHSTLGLAQYRSGARQSLGWMLTLPFKP